MRVHITRIHLANWKCYRDQVIDFHQTEDRNISVVFGNNGFGKTSLLEAIRFCLYGTEAIPKSDLISRFNRVALRQLPNLSLSVQLTIARGENAVVISRSARRIAKGTSPTCEISEPTYNLDGRELTNPREHIEALLPLACSRFYFFDGVEIKSYAQKVHSSEMRVAIERILGIPELRNLRDDARKVMAVIDQDLSTVQAAIPELKRVTDELQDKLEEQSMVQEQLDLAVSEHEAALGIFEALEIEASAQESLRTQMEEVDRKRRDVDRLKRDRDEAEVAIEQAMRQVPISLLAIYVNDVASEMQRKSMTSARRSGISAQLRSVLETALCICGRELDEAARKHIEFQLVAVPGPELTRTAMKEDAERSQLELLSLFRAPNLGDLLTRRDRIEDDLDGLQRELDRLRGGTELPTISLADLWRKVGDAEANVKTRRESIESLRRTYDSVEAQINDLRREREKFATRSAETAVLGKEAVLARRLFEAAKELIDARIAETRETIETETAAIHLAVTNKPLEYVGVEISPEDYSLRVRAASGDLLDPDTLSAGEKEALAFAFIAGLNIASGKSAPFVMDTPFGHLDISHQRNLVLALPGLPSQVTLLATDRDLPEALLSEIRPSIADTMTISRVGATDDASVIRED